jgi:hypothetical protein
VLFVTYYASSMPPTSMTIIATLVRVTADALTVFTIAAAAAAAAAAVSPLALPPWFSRPSRAALFLAFFAFLFAHRFH